MRVVRFNFKDRTSRGKSIRAVKVIITGEEKKDLQEGSSRLGDPYVDGIIGRIDGYETQTEAEKAQFGDTCYWFWIYENEMASLAFSLSCCLMARAQGKAPEAVRDAMIEEEI